jgi:hypothetical protein
MFSTSRFVYETEHFNGVGELLEILGRSVKHFTYLYVTYLYFYSSLLLYVFVNLMSVDPCITVQFTQKNPTRCNSVLKFIIPYLYEAQRVSGDTPPIIRSLKLHQQPLVLHTFKVVGCLVAGHRSPFIVLYPLENDGEC